MRYLLALKAVAAKRIYVEYPTPRNFVRMCAVEVRWLEYMRERDHTYAGALAIARAELRVARLFEEKFLC
jgi:hypothetical protein